MFNKTLLQFKLELNKIYVIYLNNSDYKMWIPLS